MEEEGAGDEHERVAREDAVPQGADQLRDDQRPERRLPPGRRQALIHICNTIRVLDRSKAVAYCTAPHAWHAVQRCGGCAYSMRYVSCSVWISIHCCSTTGDVFCWNSRNGRRCTCKHEREANAQDDRGMQRAASAACSHRRMKLPVAMFQSWGSCAALVPNSTCGNRYACQHDQ